MPQDQNDGLFLTILLLFEVFYIFGDWRTDEQYQIYLVESIAPYFEFDRKNVEQYDSALAKLYILDIDPLKPLLGQYYSAIGTPAKHHPEFIRSFILMSELGVHSISQ